MSKQLDLENSLELHFSEAPFSVVRDKVVRWAERFSYMKASDLIHTMALFALKGEKRYFASRNSSHIFRLVILIDLLEKKLIQFLTLQPTQGYSKFIQVRLIPLWLEFPFIKQPVLGCLVGINIDRYELLDKGNIQTMLSKYFPHLSFVVDSFYSHASPTEKIKIFYFEMIKKQVAPFSAEEKVFLQEQLTHHIKSGIEQLSPIAFQPNRQEDHYKTLLMLRKEIQTADDMPQAIIKLDHQTKDEIIFLVQLIFIAPDPSFSLSNLFHGCEYTRNEQFLSKTLTTNGVSSSIFYLYLKREPALLNGDESWNVFAARHKAVQILSSKIGEFRDYNGGTFAKQNEVIEKFQEEFPLVHAKNPEWFQMFLFSIAPYEQQHILPLPILFQLFSLYLQSSEKTDADYDFQIHPYAQHTFFSIRSSRSDFKQFFLSTIQDERFSTHQLVYSIMTHVENVVVQALFLPSSNPQQDVLLTWLESQLTQWVREHKPLKTVRVGFEEDIISLDPRVGGDDQSQNVLSLLFEGLTRLDEQGHVANGVAESIDISSDRLRYTFRLRQCNWNTGSPILASDFAYAWKKILSSSFKTPFASFFYLIKNAKKAKLGDIPLEQVGIEVVDSYTLRVSLEHPAPYFLHLIAHSIYSPIHQAIDQSRPQWPYQFDCEYPCNGPFCLDVHYPSQGYRLIRNVCYWNQTNQRPDQIILHRLHTQQGYEAFQKDQIDWLGYPLGHFDCPFPCHPSGRVISLPYTAVIWLILDILSSPFSNLKMRQALAYAIDRTALIANETALIKEAYSLQSSQKLCIPHNIPLARQLWEEGLQELGLSRQKLPRISFVFHQHGIQELLALKLQKQLKNVLDFDCDLKPLSWKETFACLTERKFQIAFLKWKSWIDDPMYTLNIFKTSSESLNFPGWQNRAFQSLLEQSDRILNPNERLLLLEKAEKLLCQEASVIPMVCQSNQILIRNHLKTQTNFNRNLLNSIEYIEDL